MKLERGINFGGWLSQCSHTKERYDSFISKKDVERVKSWGFDHIRLPFDYNVIENADDSDKPSGYIYLDNMVSWCAEYGLNLILDLHKAAGYDFNDAGNTKNSFNDEKLKLKFVSLWEKVAKKYGSYTHVAFELLNRSCEQDRIIMDSLISRTVSAIHKHAPVTKIIYGGIQWNSARTVKLLDKPSDETLFSRSTFMSRLFLLTKKLRGFPTSSWTGTLTIPVPWNTLLNFPSL